MLGPVYILGGLKRKSKNDVNLLITNAVSQKVIITSLSLLPRLNLLPVTYWHKLKDLIFYFKCCAGHYTLPIDDSSSLKALVPLATALIKTYYFPSAAQSSFNLSSLTVFVNSGIRYLNPLVLLLLLISLNRTYSNAIRLPLSYKLWRH